MARTAADFALDNLTTAILAGPWTHKELMDRVGRATRDKGDWRRRLVRALLKKSPDEAMTLAQLRLALRGRSCPVSVGELFIATPAMAANHGWDVPPITTVAALAKWLDISARKLLWLADVQGRTHNASDTRLQHYRQRWIAKRGGRKRLLEIPKPRLKAMQKRILRDILDRIPGHDAGHAFRTERSIITYAAPHVGQSIVMRFDLRDYFPSVPASRIHALFRSAGYPLNVTRLLTGLCTTITPSCPEMQPWMKARHLPQGGPTSPKLADLCMRRFDIRLAALAAKLGATYTRYADDLAFSGDEQLARSARRLQVLVGRIALEEGFELHYRKSRFMRAGVRQQLAGIVVNEKPNIKRSEFDRLKAILTNCVRHGPAGQNREKCLNFQNHLRGRVAFIKQINPAKGEKLLQLFDRISWTETVGQ